MLAGDVLAHIVLAVAVVHRLISSAARPGGPAAFVGISNHSVDSRGQAATLHQGVLAYSPQHSIRSDHPSGSSENLVFTFPPDLEGCTSVLLQQLDVSLLLCQPALVFC